MSSEGLEAQVPITTTILFIDHWGFEVMSKWHYILALFSNVSFAAIGSSVLHAFGVLWLAVQIVSYFRPSFITMVQQSWWMFVSVGLLIGAYRGWPRLVIRSKVKGTDSTIEIRVGDLFEQEGSVVVAAPTSFDTSMEDETIDVRSVQGQYTKRFCDSMENLNGQIEASLQGVDFEERDEAEKPYGSRRRYPVGTVASVIFKGKRAYFVSIATLNAHRIAFATRNELLDALPALWENIRTRGGIDPINIPIIGSGFSRLNATREELVREIIKSFVAATHAGRFCERLRIMVSAQDFRDSAIDLEALSRFLEHECTYGNVQETTEPTTVGTAA